MPKAKLIVELDGYPWHKNSVTRDIQKNRLLKQSGIKVLRVRDERLPKLNGNVVIVPKNVMIQV